MLNMKSKTWLFISFSLLIISGCSGKGGIGGIGGSGADANFGDISESSIEYFSQNIGDTIYFDVDQSSLSEVTISTLQAQVSWLQENNSMPITIEGHADEQGTREYNLALGARRATSVRNYLVSQGVSENRLSIVTYGKERPIEVCSQERCWSKNRRATTVVSGGLGN
tara:strand:- start:500 stop:1003 length:504 start_codon:yes stop_codon:yes gene_type:complete